MNREETIMNIDELVFRLKKIRKKHGNIQVYGVSNEGILTDSGIQIDYDEKDNDIIISGAD